MSFKSPRRMFPGERARRELAMAGSGLRWWDPGQDGLDDVAVGAYRFVRTVGTPWSAHVPRAYAQALWNWANPGVHDLTEGNGAVNWGINVGMMFNAAALQWLMTGIVPQNDQTWSMFAQFSDLANQGMIAGAISGAVNQSFSLLPNNGAAAVQYGNGAVVAAAPALAAGNIGVAGASGYRDGNADGAAIGGWGGASNRGVYIGARNNFAIGADMHVTARVRSVVIYEDVPTVAQIAAVAAAMAAL